MLQPACWDGSICLPFARSALLLVPCPWTPTVYQHPSFRVSVYLLCYSQRRAYSMKRRFTKSPLRIVKLPNAILEWFRRIYRGNPNNRVEWTCVFFFHVVVATGVGLVGAGASALQGEHAIQNDLMLVDAGISLLTAAWVFLVVWTVFSLCKPKRPNPVILVASHGTKVRSLAYTNTAKTINVHSFLWTDPIFGRPGNAVYRYSGAVLDGCIHHPFSESQPYQRFVGDQGSFGVSFRTYCDSHFHHGWDTDYTGCYR